MAGLRVTLNAGIEAVLGEAVVEASSAGLRGQLLRDGEDGYEEASKVFHGMIDRRPALITRCAGTADAINCVNFARTHDLLVAVRGGGHIDVGDEAIDTMAAHCPHRPSPLCHVVLEHTLGSSVSRIDRDATTFNHRDVPYSFLSLGVCTDPAEAETCVRWARELGKLCNPSLPAACMSTIWVERPTRAPNESRRPMAPRNTSAWCR